MEGGYKASTLLSRVTFVLSLIGFLLHMVGFYTTAWSTTSYRGIQPHNVLVNDFFGLWKWCRAAGSIFECSNFKNHGAWFEATQAFETLGFIASLAALVLIILYIFVPATSGKKIVFILSMLACFAAAGCIILGIIIYGSKVENNLSWSFALCTIAGIIFGVSGIILVIDMLKR